MSAPLVPSPLDYIGRRRFAFYPAIKNIGANEWVLGTGSWTEVQVVNSMTGAEIWVPRQYIGGVSESGGPTLIVGLTTELEYHAGTLEPCIKRVIEMPLPPLERPKISIDTACRSEGPAPVVGIRIEDVEHSSMNKVMMGIGIGALVVALLAALISILARF